MKILRLLTFGLIFAVALTATTWPQGGRARSSADGVSSAGIPEGAELVGVTNQSGLAPDLLTFFNFDNPAQILGGSSVSGLEPDEKITGFDYDSAASKIIGITNFGNVVFVDPQTGQATSVARISSSLVRGKLASDFDSTTRVLRIISETGPSTQIDLSNFPTRVEIDSTPTYVAEDINAGNTPKIAGMANNKAAGSTGGNIFVIDSNKDVVAILDGFGLKTLGALGLDTTSMVGFSALPGSNFGIASMMLEGEDKVRLFRVSLIDGEAVEIGSGPLSIPLGGLGILLENKNQDEFNCDVLPPEDKNPVGTSHSIKVIVTKNGVPVQNAFVLVGILVGPNRGVSGHGRTRNRPETEDEEGEFDFSYQSNGTIGIDLITVGVVVEGKILFCQAIKKWVPEPDDGSELPGAPGLLTITDVEVRKKKVFVKGCCFKPGDIIVINDKAQKTKNDPAKPDTIVIANKGGKKLEQCVNGSTNRVFVRRQLPGQPIQDTQAFATCP